MELTVAQRNRRCEVLLDQGRFEQALVEARLAVAAADADRSDAYYNLTRALIGLNQNDEAFTTAGKSIAEAPERPHGYYLRAVILRTTGNLIAAEAAARDALARSANYSVYYRELASVLLKDKRPAQALEVIDQGLKYDAQSITLHQKRVQALYDLGRAIEANQAAELALSIDPLNPTTHFQAGTTLLSLANFPAAEMHLRESVRLDPTSAQAKEQLVGLLYSRTFYYKWAVKKIGRRLAMIRRFAVVLIFLSYISVSAGKSRQDFIPWVPFWALLWEYVARYLYYPCRTLWLYRLSVDRPLFPLRHIIASWISVPLIVAGLTLQLGAPIVHEPRFAIAGASAFLLVIPITLASQKRGIDLRLLILVAFFAFIAVDPLLVASDKPPGAAFMVLLQGFCLCYFARTMITLAKWRER